MIHHFHCSFPGPPERWIENIYKTFKVTTLDGKTITDQVVGVAFYKPKLVPCTSTPPCSGKRITQRSLIFESSGEVMTDNIANLEEVEAAHGYVCTVPL